MQPHTVHIRNKVIAVVLLETFLTSTFLLRPLRQHQEVFGLHSNEEAETAAQEWSRAQKPTSNGTTDFSNTCHCETYTSKFRETALKNNVTSVEQSCYTKRCNLFNLYETGMLVIWHHSWSVRFKFSLRYVLMVMVSGIRCIVFNKQGFELTCYFYLQCRLCWIHAAHLFKICTNTYINSCTENLKPNFSY